MIRFTLNGEASQTPLGTSVRALLMSLDIDPATGGIAVAVNASVVPRSHWPETFIEVNDEVEIVRATAGG